MKIIPAIDLIGGKCVRLTKGDYDTKKEYHSDPLEVAKNFEGAGIERLHLVDLDGAKAGKIINYKVLERIASKTGLKIDFGGGLRTDDDVRIAFESGAGQITGGSIAVKNRPLFESWIAKYGPDKIILGADVIDEKIAVSGWQETSSLDLYEFLESYWETGLREVICTDVSKDGMLQGAATELYKKMMERFPDMRLIASGGVATMDDLHELSEIGCFGAITGKAIYEGRISLREIERFH
ncbi:1-(5-phosphoribosyl)-5-[(5-phosphoribosylamino) methylideneamino] imidazole-4-carboxamide isomerase [Fulvitalea axinellae]|uniref:1-(5-phosphoribosyl)-5-[(5-phosphoribosylamino)methylideneamino] imidazole-4-carboxamide isomerase n=1 Tax=Fulvitalea axinellae TaxID=1182444 RepID=A0AAU9CS81_9BACT|nr:1-(5-phosphoribosyl)-5-[(5-phosphoribosylamino) methylideneamino] imidazole-4-carboxamide isomerase [Fulvitalea axinellae]